MLTCVLPDIRHILRMKFNNLDDPDHARFENKYEKSREIYYTILPIHSASDAIKSPMTYLKLLQISPESLQTI